MLVGDIKSMLYCVTSACRICYYETPTNLELKIFVEERSLCTGYISTVFIAELYFPRMAFIHGGYCVAGTFTNINSIRLIAYVY